MKVVSVGEILWDVFPDREFLGGAPLNVCANLQRCGDEAVLISAVGQDARGSLALEGMKALGLTTMFMQQVTSHATGIAKVDHDINGQPSFTIERPAAFDAMTLSPELLRMVDDFEADWVYAGTLLQTEPAMEQLVGNLLERLPEAQCFYDMNLRAGHWNLPLVERLCERASILKLNEDEAETLAGLTGTPRAAYSLDSFCVQWAQRFKISVICVTLGPEGCCIYAEGAIQRFPGFKVKVSDTVGAGDAFAAAFLHGYDSGWAIARCAAFANALGALVASKPGATPVWLMGECLALAALAAE